MTYIRWKSLKWASSCAFIVITRFVLAWQAGHANTVIVTDLLFAVVVGFGFGNGAIFKLVAQYFPKNTARQSQEAKEQRFKVQASARPGNQGS